MHVSRYTTTVQGGNGNLLLFNTANGAFAELEGNAARAWESGPCSGPAAEQLLQLGFLTELSPSEELARQQELFDHERADTSTLTLSLLPTYACNFRCPYCYELGHNKIKGKMGDRTMTAIERFIQKKFDADGFSKLSVQWYGGDPSLALDEVAELSQRLMSWANSHGVAYEAVMLTNANTIDAEAALRIAECEVSTVLLTIDGPEELHNKRRVAANGSNSYQRTIEAARLLRSYGIRLVATMNADKVNILHYEELRRKLLEEEGIALGMAKLNDYGHFFGKAPFCSPDFELFEHEEFFRAQFEEFAKCDHDAAEMREMLKPVRRFCTGQLENYFIIDLLGDVYRCDGRVGENDHVVFNLFDDEQAWKLHEITFDATRDAKCGPCELLPICQGNCLWERECSGMPCHPFKTTLGDYLRVYRSCFDDEPCGPSGVRTLAEPFAPEELGWL
ncbi:MAG: radical SAM protein [Coriobacteriaceae bacterium]|nr:radical SAM protein [Coriobacteriaceae bacterium]